MKLEKVGVDMKQNSFKVNAVNGCYNCRKCVQTVGDAKYFCSYGRKELPTTLDAWCSNHVHFEKT